MKQAIKIPIYNIADVVKKKDQKRDYDFYRLDEFLFKIEHLAKVHRHDHFSLFFISAGNGKHTVDFQECDLKPNRLLLLRPGQVHAWLELRGLKGFVLLLTKDFFSLTQQFRDLQTFLFSDSNSNYYVDLNEEDARDLISIFEKIEIEQKEQNVYHSELIRSYINILLFRLKRLSNSSGNEAVSYDLVNLKILEFEKLVKANFKMLRTTSDYAKLLKLNANYLNMICRARLDKSAGEIIRDRILLEAKYLLVHSDYGITQIAEELNFPDNSYFARFFKKYTGQTATQFKNESRKM